MSDEFEDESMPLPQKIIAGLAVLFLLSAFFGMWGFLAGRYEVFPYRIISPVTNQISQFIAGLQDDNKSLTDIFTMHRQELPLKYEVDGFVQNDPDFTDPGYLLLSRFDKEVGQVVIDLMKIDGFERKHRWIPPVDELVARSGSLANKYTNNATGYRVNHPYLLEDGSIITHPGQGPLAKLDKDSQLVWITNLRFHHSIERDHNGNFLVPINNQHDKIQTWPENLMDDGYAVVSPAGEVLERYSFGKILLENGYRGLFLGAGFFHSDRLHINDIEPIFEDNGVAKRGDVAVSIRDISTVLLYRPSTDKIIWLENGPWLFQHDVDLLPDGTFSVFDNNIVFIPDEKGGQKAIPGGESSHVWIYDPVTRKSHRPYKDIFINEALYTPSQGRSEILSNGDVFVEETDFSRIVRTSPEKLRWTYVNKVTDTTAGALHWCRYLREDQVTPFWE